MGFFSFFRTSVYRDEFVKKLQEVSSKLTGDRESFADISSGPIKKSYVMHVDIEDRPGVLAEVVMYLAIAGINIKNIGITHNREYQQGVLRVECHSSDGLEKARELLTNRNYSVY